MINSFLVSLHNNATPPVNVSSNVGDVLWPSALRIKVYSGPAELAERVLFNELPTGSFDHFLAAIQFLWVVQESVCADTILADDPRVSYTQAQLLGQFIDNTTADRQNVSRALQRLNTIPALSFLTGRALRIYRSALSPMDRLAAILSYFGSRDESAS